MSMPALAIVDPSKVAELADASCPVLANSTRVEQPHRINPHQHLRGQLVAAAKGLLEVVSGAARFIVPPKYAVWIPAGVSHSVTAPVPVEYRSLFVDPGVNAGMPGNSCLLQTTPLLRELTRTAASIDPSRLGSAELRLQGVILDQLAVLRPAPYALPLPSRERLQRMARRVLLQPQEQHDIEDWAAELYMSPRSLVRQFKQDTGMSFGHWLRRVRVMKAMELLDDGCSVTAVSLAVGYQQASAFIAMFRRETGMTPAEYARQTHRR